MTVFIFKVVEAPLEAGHDGQKLNVVPALVAGIHELQRKLRMLAGSRD